MKKFWKWLLVVLAILLVVDVGAGMYFFHVAEVRGTKSFINNDGKITKNDPLRTQKLWYQRVKKEKWTMKSATDDLKLEAYYIPAAHPTNKTVILAHGFLQNKDGEGAPAAMFHDLGYNVLAPDDRAHGKSEGKLIGYGWLDRRDYIKWMQKLLREKGANQKLVMYGVSMGGATTMMLSGEPDVPHQVKAYIEDCGYTSVEDEITYQAKSMYHLPKWPLVPTVSLISKIRAGYSYGEASAMKQLAKNHKPMLFIHGGKDDFVPTKMIDQLYAATKGPKEKYVVKNAGHAKAMQADYQQYRDRVKNFLEKNV
ncbi:alpha/beta fold hydrolase [Pediococcus acidilactici]|nr:alpha/beta fold hydrolase [Pediococcus acidilactici]UWF34143.1 alpha/beta hydrolase [Pediococcus acidilactici]